MTDPSNLQPNGQETFEQDKKLKLVFLKYWPQVRPFLFILLFILTIYLSLFTFIPGLQNLLAGMGSNPERSVFREMSTQEALKYQKKTEAEINAAARKILRLQPIGNYMIVNTHENTFRIYRGSRLIREGNCSTGSYVLLEAGEEQKWIFKTPQGMYRIQGKIADPVWRKPDWAFIEEGLPVPPPTHHSRYEYGVLGDYAMSIGNGYLIHGTLYKRYIGLPVTHGCIRLNDDDLEFAFRTLETGSRVYIY